MNKIFTIGLALMTVGQVWAQTSKEVATGASYVNDAYYSLENGTVGTQARSNWDIAFATDRYSISILANNGYGVELYTYPNGNSNAWASVDIANIGDWTQMYNSTSDIDAGAFTKNMVPGDDFDYGWGRYNMGTHFIEGDSLFIVKTVAGTYKKLLIINKNPNTGGNAWQFKYADIDGANEQTITITADDYITKNYVFYSIDNDVVVDREPASNDWDLLFTKYYDYAIPYNVTGVMINSKHITAQEVDGVTAATYTAYEETSFIDSLTIIGSDWKSFNMSTYNYEVDADRVYFLKQMTNNGADSSYWKIYFTAFSGSFTGVYTFNQENLSSSSIDELESLSMFEIYPIPAKNSINLIFDTKEALTVNIYDIQGRLIHSVYINNIGFSQQKIDVSSFKSGVYIMQLSNMKGLFEQRFVIE
ncbi:MAG: T9SS type A sorting domain-containing protein [Bacteroidales bacterium]|nr:T9SS type A sorting domain-containing protein [Bacteroidales bacterium]